jgi:hypothetical protein
VSSRNNETEQRGGGREGKKDKGRQRQRKRGREMNEGMKAKRGEKER